MTGDGFDFSAINAAYRRAALEVADYYPPEGRGECEWPVNTGGFPWTTRSCGNGGVGEAGGVHVCWQHRERLIGAAIRLLSDPDIPERIDAPVGAAMVAFLVREWRRAEAGGRRRATDLGAVIGEVIRGAAESGIDLGLPLTVDDLVEKRLEAFLGAES